MGISAQIQFQFSGEVWLHGATGGWYFVTVSAQLSSEIRAIVGNEEQGWGRLKVKAVIDHLSWDTAIWYDTKQKAYLLPLKASIRKEKGIAVGDQIEVVLFI